MPPTEKIEKIPDEDLEELFETVERLREEYDQEDRGRPNPAGLVSRSGDRELVDGVERVPIEESSRIVDRSRIDIDTKVVLVSLSFAWSLGEISGSTGLTVAGVSVLLMIALALEQGEA